MRDPRYDPPMLKKRIATITAVGLIFLLLIFLLVPNWPKFADEEVQLDMITGRNAFDFVSWEVDALLAKATAALSDGAAYLDEETQKEIVLDYLERIRQSNYLNWEIEQIYTDPEIENPEIVSQEAQLELATVRKKTQRVQVLAEAIIQDQVATILAEEGFSLAGQTWPPVMMHMTPLPTMMVVSPRDEIQNKYQRPLTPGLTTVEKDAMETAVYDQANLSALIVPIGGMATYPAMIMESSSILWLPEVTAHEWAHNWLSPYPLSLNYMTDPDVRTINETVASIVGKEIQEQVIARYYPEFILPPPPAPSDAAIETPTAPPPFDFRAEMAKTRRVVDKLLSEGKIDEAETYMEQRRHIFVENGYNIRKINQAYFAFYGAYADEPGATGDDPIGPTLLAMREVSPSLKAFMQSVAIIGSFEDFEQAAAELGITVAANQE